MTVLEKLTLLDKDTKIIARNIFGIEKEITKDHAIKNIHEVVTGFQKDKSTIVLIMDI